MKKLLDNELSLDELKHALKAARNKDNKRNFYIFAGIVIALLLVTIGGVCYVLKKKSQNPQEDDWDCDWEDDDDDDLREFDESEEYGDCRCTDKDIDKSVKVEKL